jgi:Ras-related protein Rab-2A
MSYQYLFKIIVVGDTATGKSSSIVKLSDHTFDPCYQMTIGVEFASMMFEVEGEPIKVQIWDTAGQESFHSITRSYYRGSAGVLLFYDVTRRSTFDHLRDWLYEIKGRCHQSSVVMLIGNKTDQSHARQVSFFEGDALAKEHCLLFCETSCCGSDVYSIMDAYRLLVLEIHRRVKSGELDPSEDTGVKLGLSSRKGNVILQEKKAGCCVPVCGT